MTGARTGGCLCGAVRYCVTGELSAVAVCHCGMCRRWHGAPGAYTNAPRAAFRLTEARGLKWYPSSSFARRGFCGECGSSLFWDAPGRATISITAGSLDQPTGLKTALQIFARDKGDYYDLDRAVPVRKE